MKIRPAIVLLSYFGFLCANGVAWADDLELSLTTGGTQQKVEGGGELDGQWGLSIEPGFSLAPFKGAPQFRLGAGVELAWVSADVDNEFISGQADLFLITPELRVSWRQNLTDHLSLEPGVGGGIAIGALDFVGVEWGSGYSVRPFVRAGYAFDHWSTGVELAYRFGHLNFDGADGDIENLNVAVFFNYQP